MAKHKYTVKNFHQQFKTDADCLEFIYRSKYPEGASCPACNRKDQFYALKGRRSYSCACGHQISPTVGTIFHKSPTSLKSWFTAMFLMMTSKNGVAAKELERQLGVTYKCAWRMAHQIRQLLKEDVAQLKGIVEADETYIGGRQKMKSRNSNKTPIIGVLERDGKVIAHAVKSAGKRTILGNIFKNVDYRAMVMTDEYVCYQRLSKAGYSHQTVAHAAHEWTRGIVHTNTIEGFWSQLKRSIHGTFHSVSRKHLQKYVNEFAYRYNRRKSGTPMFLHALEGVAALHDAAV
jgi:transposase-like protein/Zn ribbon nucleic-acid-binding protein